MDHYDLAYAREHLGELLDRAARGEVVSITDPKRGTFRLAPDGGVLPPRKVRLGLLEGKMTVPARLFEPMGEDELRDWYGE